MKIVAIGDTHGRKDWKKIVEAHPDADKIVFIGDYFDTHDDIFDSEILANFKEIVDLKRHHMGKVVLLIGNHDFHYLAGITEHYSGYNRNKAFEYQQALEGAITDGLMQMAFAANGHLFSHAGVTKTWATKNGATTEASINKLFDDNRQAFCFSGMNPYGDDVTNSPIWVRPGSLEKDALEGYVHVVGHTQVKGIIISSNIILIDTLGQSGQYLIINDGIPSPHKA